MVVQVLYAVLGEDWHDGPQLLVGHVGAQDVDALHGMVEGVVEEMFLGRSDLGPLCFELQLLGSLYGGTVVVMLKEE